MPAARHLHVIVVALLALCGLVTVGAFSAVGSDVTMEGRLLDIHSDDFAHGRSQHEYRLETAQGTYELRFADRYPQLPRASRVSVHGQRSGNTLTVAAGSVSTAPGSTAIAPVTGAKKIAVILFTLSDNTTQPYTPAYAQGVAFTNANSVAAYYGESSWGQVTLSGDVFGWYQLADKSLSCDYSNWASDADAAAKAAGVDLSAYDYRVYGFPSVSACNGWAGLSYLPGTQAWLQGSAGMSLHVMAHELGHDFGTHHANSYSCTANGVRVSLAASTASCTSAEYGDPFSVMGGLTSRRQQTNFSRANFGWLTTANTIDVSTSGTYALHPIEPSDPTGVQALRVKRDSSTYFLLELRQPYGSSFDNFSTLDPAVNGVMVRIVPAYSTLVQSQLVDATPATSSFSDAALGLGNSLYDPVSKLTFATAGISTTGATVQVTFGSGSWADTSPPTTPASLGASATDATHIALSWGASTDNVGVSGYRVYRGGGYLATTSAASYTDSGLAPGTTYSYYVTAFDVAGNESPASNTAGVTTPSSGTTSLDTTPPSAPTNLTVARPGNRPRVDLAWGASTDDVGVAAYRVYFNGSLLTTVSGTTLGYSLKPPKGTDSYSVGAVDAAGNASGLSNTAALTI
jgi:hypothetical protein